ncbi:MAG: hypothetical protein FWH20_06590 [Oscillospiraceae bacterium]|nr:hypothetical protein [Oscillospiraceae bacterium]
MNYFYLIILFASAALLITDMVLRYMEKIESFGVEKKLFKLTGSTIPIEKFLPENLTMAVVFFLTFGAAGFFLELVGVRIISLPIALMAGFFACFTVQYFAASTIAKVKNKTLPKGDAAADIQGFAYEEIDGAAGDYGVVEFLYNGVEFHAPAVSANGTKIPKFEKVVIIFEENGFYFVQSILEVFEALNE